MRILALVTDAFGGYGGIAQYNRDLLTALSMSSLIRDIVVIPRLVAGDLSGLPAKVEQLEPRIARSAYILSAMRVVQQRGPFDVIFSGHLYHCSLAALIGRLWKAPVWLQTHGVDAWEAPNLLVRHAAERAALITTVSRFTKHRLSAWANVEPERVRVLPNTFRPMFVPGDVDDICLARFGLTGRKIILTVARLAKADLYKGHRKLINVLPLVLRQHPDAVYVVVGDGNARAQLEALVVARGLGGAVRFLGRLGDADVLQLYRSSHVFAMPSTKEGFGIVFVEAAATGLPVIGGNCDGSADALADGVIGTMLDPDDTEGLAAAVNNALSGNTKSAPDAVLRFAFSNFAHHVDALVRTFPMDRP